MGARLRSRPRGADHEEFGRGGGSVILGQRYVRTRRILGLLPPDSVLWGFSSWFRCPIDMVHIWPLGQLNREEFIPIRSLWIITVALSLTLYVADDGPMPRADGGMALANLVQTPFRSKGVPPLTGPRGLSGDPASAALLIQPRPSLEQDPTPPATALAEMSCPWLLPPPPTKPTRRRHCRGLLLPW